MPAIARAEVERPRRASDPDAGRRPSRRSPRRRRAGAGERPGRRSACTETRQTAPSRPAKAAASRIAGPVARRPPRAAPRRSRRAPPASASARCATDAGEAFEPEQRRGRSAARGQVRGAAHLVGRGRGPRVIARPAVASSRPVEDQRSPRSPARGSTLKATSVSTAERAVAAGHQLDEVEAGDVLHHPPAVLDHGAACRRRSARRSGCRGRRPPGCAADPEALAATMPPTVGTPLAPVSAACVPRLEGQPLALGGEQPPRPRRAACRRRRRGSARPARRA